MLDRAELTTPRLIVRPFHDADGPALIALFADPRVHRFVDDGRPLTPARARLWITRSRENLARYGYGTGAVIARDGEKLIGWAGFARPGDGSEELIYGLAADHWGRGLGRELLRALLRFAEARAIAPVRATVDPRNVRSIALLTRNGFTLAAKGHGGDPDSDLYLRG
ncbi:GNAT family N-acetyltransferase [Sphingosinicella sp. BN140058]|uniref:GNAT family N-acetyltransferase n=1 Tax=Sphingosinicella sp. BN140058 TaxID=1892855 RepID=UPI0010125FE2|nr:GNAT family N-acetyltransferase [Sphingosinicella sp. BN140058]QAY77822.1 N-acetyltransferase [Sphingosinicella sp. BN140058]